MSPYYPSIKRPVVVLIGKQEGHRNIAWDAHRLASMAANTRLVKLENAGHYLHYQSPQAVVEAIDSLR